MGGNDYPVVLQDFSGMKGLLERTAPARIAMTQFLDRWSGAALLPEPTGNRKERRRAKSGKAARKRPDPRRFSP